MQLQRVTLFAALILLYRPLPVLLWSPTYLLQFIVPMTTFMHSQEVLWFISEVFDAKHSAAFKDFFVAIHKATGLTQLVLTNRSDLRLMNTSCRKNSLSIIFTTAPDDPIMTLHDKVMSGRHFFLSVFVSVKALQDLAVVERYVRFMHMANFQNSALYFRRANDSTNHVFTYNRYPTMSVVNATDFVAFVKKRGSYILNGGERAYGFAFRTPLREDLPYVFRYVAVSGRTELHGSAFRVISVFMDYINGTLQEHAMPKDTLGGDVIDMRAALDLVRNGEIELLAHAYALFSIDEDIDKSYPIMVVKWCLMVPILNSFSTFYYPVQPFEELVWGALLGVFVTLVLLDCLQAWSHGQQLDFSHCLLDNFCLILNMTTARLLATPSSLESFAFRSAIFFYGFFLYAMYASLLGSFLTVKLFRQQIHTMDDLIRFNISVMIIDYELEFLKLADHFSQLPASFIRLLLPVDAATFSAHQVALNRTFAYFVTDDRWHFLSRQQRHLTEGSFKFSDICFGSHHLAFPMTPNSQIWRSLEYFLYRMHSSGMLQHYETNSFLYAVHAGLAKRHLMSNEYTSAGMQHLMMVFVVLALASFLGACILIVECLVYRGRIKR